MLDEIKKLIYSISNRDILYEEIKKVILKDKEKKIKTINKEELIDFLIKDNLIESKDGYIEDELISYLSDYVQSKCNWRVIEFDIHEGYALYEGEIMYENKLYPYTIEERDQNDRFDITFEI